MIHSRYPALKCLLVNPWIADFAAYNFWVRPLGLYRLAEWLNARGVDLSIIDCLSPFRAPGKFRRQVVPPPMKSCLEMDRNFARYGITRQEFRERLKRTGAFDCVFITSVMSYWYPGIQWVVEEIKSTFPAVPIILGGIYATLWPEHAKSACGADLVCQGPLKTCAEKIAAFLGLPRQALQPERPWYLLEGIIDAVDYWAVRTAQGCPFSCSYCASRIVSGPFATRSPVEVIREIVFLHSRGIRQIAFYDDALLVDFENRLARILKGLAQKGISLTFHTPNGLHARLVSKETAQLLARSGFKSIRLSLETTNPERQAATGGKVSSKDLEKAVKNLLEAGMPAPDIGVYLLVGLPGQELEEIEEGINYVKSLGVRPYLAEFSPIPGTSEWKRLERNGVVSMDMDPILTNNSLFFRLFSGYDMNRFKRLKKLAASLD